MSVRVTVDRNWQKHIQANLHELLDKLGEDITEDAKRLAPVESGKLRDSISYEVEDRTVHVYSDVDYSPFVEAGTSVMNPQPYLKPALYKNRES